MKFAIQVLIIAFLLSACKPNELAYTNYESEALKIEQITEHIFKHTSYLNTNNYGKYPCNGMIYIKGNEAIVFDTPTNDSASAELLEWIGNKKIKAVVVTHFHVDCLGGLKEFHTKGIASFASHQTIQLAKSDNKAVLPQNGFDNTYEFQIDDQVVLTKHFGQGHTKDNIVAYIPSEKTLFGGCLIKPLNGPKGNLDDANTAEWSETIEKIKREFLEIKHVIPGHGKNGGAELLDYTIELFKVYDEKFVFFLHNRFLENHDLTEPHPEYGIVAYQEILSEFEKSGLTVISEKRNGTVNAREYAERVENKIDSLLAIGANPKNISVVGTSKGGYIAQYVSTIANNPELNFVFIASFQEQDIQNLPEINYCGNILNIYEKSDPYGVSAIRRIENSTCSITNFKEIELNTEMGHGFLFKPLKEWIYPCINWANGNYNLESNE